MYRLLTAIVLALVLASPAQAAVTFGLSTGIGSAKGEDSEHTYNSFTPLTLFIGLIGDNEYAFESGYSQLADIKEKAGTEEINITINGIFISGRYFLQFSDTGFAYAKLGIHHWSGDAKVSDSSSGIEVVTASGSASGFTPMIGFGADFVLPGGDFGIRVDYERLTEIGDGIFDNAASGSSTSSYITDGSFVSEGYEYDKLSVGFLVAF